MDDLNPDGPVTMVKDNPGGTPAASDDAGTTQQDPKTVADGQAQGDDKGADGQGATAPAAGQGATAPAAGQGDKSPEEPVIPEFFDPSKLPEELKPAYKNMQAAFSKKMQGIAQSRQKVEAYDQFMANPQAQIQALAKEYGLDISPAGRTSQPGTGNGQTPIDGNWEPQGWQDVVEKVSEAVLDKVQGNFKPMVDSVQQMKAQNIEKQLDSIDPQWRLYEDDMRQSLSKHPTLVKDVGLLYRMSVPQEVLQGKATQAALKKLQNKAKSTRVHGGATTPKTATIPKQASNFGEAVNIARELTSKGGAG